MHDGLFAVSPTECGVSSWCNHHAYTISLVGPNSSSWQEVLLFAEQAPVGGQIACATTLMAVELPAYFAASSFWRISFQLFHSGSKVLSNIISAPPAPLSQHNVNAYVRSGRLKQALGALLPVQSANVLKSMISITRLHMQRCRISSALESTIAKTALANLASAGHVNCTGTERRMQAGHVVCTGAACWSKQPLLSGQQMTIT
jgi:hypothetical protein